MTEFVFKTYKDQFDEAFNRIIRPEIIANSPIGGVLPACHLVPSMALASLTRIYTQLFGDVHQMKPWVKLETQSFEYWTHNPSQYFNIDIKAVNYKNFNFDKSNLYDAEWSLGNNDGFGDSTLKMDGVYESFIKSAGYNYGLSMDNLKMEKAETSSNVVISRYSALMMSAIHDTIIIRELIKMVLANDGIIDKRDITETIIVPHEGKYSVSWDKDRKHSIRFYPSIEFKKLAGL